MQEASPLVSSLPLPVAAPWLEGLDWVLARSHRSEGAFANLYLLGRTIPTDVDFRGFKGYYLVAYAFKVPLATQLLVLAGLGAWVAALRRSEHGKEAAFLLVPAAFFWIYFNFFHWVFPPSAVLAFWGVVFFFYFPKAAKGEDERPNTV